MKHPICSVLNNQCNRKKTYAKEISQLQYEIPIKNCHIEYSLKTHTYY